MREFICTDGWKLGHNNILSESFNVRTDKVWAIIKVS
jgi:hypothetical protein